jgi:uncharacterized alkaline shock family protein YloU
LENFQNQSTIASCNLRNNAMKKVDTKEFELPDTTYSRDIDNRVFQGIVTQCLAKIPGVALVESNMLGNLLGAASGGLKGIHTVQDLSSHSVSITVEVQVAYGVVIPEKAEEIQTTIVKEISRLCGLHVAEVHVIFKGLIPNQAQSQSKEELPYTDVF